MCHTVLSSSLYAQFYSVSTLFPALVPPKMRPSDVQLTKGWAASVAAHTHRRIRLGLRLSFSQETSVATPVLHRKNK